MELQLNLSWPDIHPKKRDILELSNETRELIIKKLPCQNLKFGVCKAMNR